MCYNLPAVRAFVVHFYPPFCRPFRCWQSCHGYENCWLPDSIILYYDSRCWCNTVSVEKYCNSFHWIYLLVATPAKSWRSLKVGLYFRRRQALWHAFIRFSNAYKSVLRRICLYFSRRHQRRQRARESVARRKMLQSSTVLNFHALRQRTQAIQPIIYRCHELSLQRIDLAITS